MVQDWHSKWAGTWICHLGGSETPFSRHTEGELAMSMLIDRV